MTQAEQRPDENSSTAQAEIERLKQELSRERDMHLRARADFDNYRKRVQREWDSAAQAGKRQLVLALLDVMDDFERAFAYTCPITQQSDNEPCLSSSKITTKSSALLAPRLRAT